MPRKSLLIILCAGLLSACSSPSFQDQPGSEFSRQGLSPVQYSGFAEAFARRDADIASYRVVDISPLDTGDVDIPQAVVSGILRRDWQMTPEREEELRQIWAESMDRAFAAYARADSGPGVLRITAQLTRVAPGRPTATTVGGALQPAGSSENAVELWMEFRLYRADDGELLAVIRDNRTITSVAFSRTARATLTSLFGSWAALLHTRVSGE